MRDPLPPRHFRTALVTLAALTYVAAPALAERPPTREWTAASTSRLTGDGLPYLIRSTAGTTWVKVGQACDPADTVGSPDGQTVDHVWCFEGANGDSTWPCVPPGQDTGSRKEAWDHWSSFAPPVPALSRWHVTTRHGNGATGGNYNAWAGCDSVGTNPGCTDVAFWIFRDGYGDDWNYSLVLDASGQDASSGGTIEFDLRYDAECDYDYLYLEYLDTGSSEWEVAVDTAGVSAVFNAVSGNPDLDHGGTGRACGDDIYGHSDIKDLGGGGQLYYGNSVWLEDVTFPLPVQLGGLQLRWRAFSDGAWSDADGRGDTDGIGAVDNIELTFAASGSVVSDDFETGDLDGISATQGSASWSAGGIEGNTYDGWHLTFDPMYKNKGNTCFFSDDWMWAAKPDVGPIPENGFHFFLVSPVIDVNGWTGGVVEYADYQCIDAARQDFSNTHVRLYDANLGGWSLWDDFDGFYIFGGCEFWSPGDRQDLTSHLGSSIDSLQVAWSLLDLSNPGEVSWGKHGGVQYLVDNVSFGSFDGEATVFTARVIDLFADTFSHSDPAHTPFLQNPEQGKWIGHSCPGFDRLFASVESLSVEVDDFNGVTDGNVTLHWRHDDGGTAFGAWNSKTMDLAIPDPLSSSDEGTYRMIIGADDGGPEDAEGTPGNCRIWKPGTTVEYYVKTVDDGASEEATFPRDALGTGAPLRFSILPFGNETPDGEAILLVDDYGRPTLDFENSSGFQPSGGVGFGGFTAPVFIEPEVMVTDALDLLYPPQGLGDGIVNATYLHHFDRYEVRGAGSSIQCEPRGVSDTANGVGGFLSDLGVPNYDALIWLQGTFDNYSYADTTRIALGIYLDAGGKLFSTGDNVAFHLGPGGNDADSTLGFLQKYLGISFPSSLDRTTDHRMLNVIQPASPFGLYTVYGECPLRRTFDRLTLAVPSAGSSNEVLYEYTDGGAGDNGRPAVIENTRTASGGVAIHAAFGIETLLGRDYIACVLHDALVSSFGLAPPVNEPMCVIVDSTPGSSPGFGFGLGHASPNPFAKSTAIRFGVAARGRVTLDVYNVLGQKVRTLVDEILEPDAYVREWDGRSDDGARVSSGIYFYEMKAAEFRDTKKVVRLR